MKPVFRREVIENLLLTKAMIECPETHVVVAIFVENMADYWNAKAGDFPRRWLGSRYAERLANLIGVDIDLLRELPTKIKIVG